MKPGEKNSYNSLTDIRIDGKNFKIYSLPKAETNGLNGISKLPKSLKTKLKEKMNKYYQWFLVYQKGYILIIVLI